MNNYSNSNSNLPYTRSRTNLFISYRSSSSRLPLIKTNNNYGNYDDNSYSNMNENGGEGGGESSRLMGGMEETIIDMSSTSMNALPPKWVDLADSVDEILSKIKPKSKYYFSSYLALL